MSARIWTSLLLAFTIVAQLSVPAGLIVRRELALHRGIVLRFRTAPVDPADAFRGRYVALGFVERSAPCSVAFRPHQPLYVRAETGADGFARLVDAARHPGSTGVWFRASSGYSGGTTSVLVDLPFDRFYLDEDAAPQAEKIYREANRRNPAAGKTRETWLQVRVYHGLAVPEDLCIDGRPIGEALRQAR